MSLILLLTDTVYFLATVACLLLFLVVVIRSPPQAVVIVLQCGTCATAAPDVSAARRQHQMQEQPNNEGEHTEDVDAEIWETPVQETQPVRTRLRLNDEPANEESDWCTPVQETSLELSTVRIRAAKDTQFC